jgi:hypothetical protein
MAHCPECRILTSRGAALMELIEMSELLNLGCVDLRFGDGLDGRRQIGGNATTNSGPTTSDDRGD